MPVVFAGFVALCALVAYVIAGYLVVSARRRTWAPLSVAVAITVGAVVSVAVAIAATIPFMNLPLSWTGAWTYLGALLIAAIIGSRIGLWTLGRRA